VKRQPYNAALPLYAREPMRFSGVSVAAGERIPDRPDRQRRVLYRTGKVCHEAPSKAPAVREVTIQMPGVISADLADRLEQRERKQRTKRS
jgi:hypothetical protein